MNCLFNYQTKLFDLGVFHLLKNQPSPEIVEGKGGYGFDKLNLLALKPFETHPNQIVTAPAVSLKTGKLSSREERKNPRLAAKRRLLRRKRHASQRQPE